VLYVKLTTTDACTTLVVYKKAQNWLIREPCNYTTTVKVYLRSEAWGVNLYTCILYLVYILYSILAAYKSRAGFSVHKCVRSQSGTVYTGEVKWFNVREVYQRKPSWINFDRAALAVIIINNYDAPPREHTWLPHDVNCAPLFESFMAAVRWFECRREMAGKARRAGYSGKAGWAVVF